MGIVTSFLLLLYFSFLFFLSSFFNTYIIIEGILKCWWWWWMNEWMMASSAAFLTSILKQPLKRFVSTTNKNLLRSWNQETTPSTISLPFRYSSTPSGTRLLVQQTRSLLRLSKCTIHFFVTLWRKRDSSSIKIDEDPPIDQSLIITMRGHKKKTFSVLILAKGLLILWGIPLLYLSSTPHSPSQFIYPSCQFSPKGVRLITIQDNLFTHFHCYIYI